MIINTTPNSLHIDDIIDAIRYYTDYNANKYYEPWLISIKDREVIPMDDLFDWDICFNCGMNGNCGETCPMYMIGECGYCEENTDVIKESEENYMNKNWRSLVDLYYGRQNDILREECRKSIEKEYNSNEDVQEYNKIIDTFLGALNCLYDTQSNETRTFVRTGYTFERDTLPVEINCQIKEEIRDKHQEILDCNASKLLRTKKEVEALLELSDDLEYQTKILVEYGIIDKKTMRVN